METLQNCESLRALTTVPQTSVKTNNLDVDVQAQQVEPYSVQVTSKTNSLMEKRHRLREAGLWRNAPRYYAGLNGFVEVNLTI